MVDPICYDIDAERGEDMNVKLAVRRPRHLAIATANCLANFCSLLEWTEEGRSDRFWLRIFSDPSYKPSELLIEYFINQYTLHRQGRWDFQNIIQFLERFGRGGTALPGEIDKLADDLGDCLPRRLLEKKQTGEERRAKKARQFSAASKFAFFCQPHAQHFIFDSVATAALEGRQSCIIPRQYSQYVIFAQKEYEAEGHDFEQAFKAYLELQIYDAQFDVPTAFHRRYFFDKLLIAQGAYVQAERIRLKAGQRIDLVPRRPSATFSKID